MYDRRTRARDESGSFAFPEADNADSFSNQRNLPFGLSVAIRDYGTEVRRYIGVNIPGIIADSGKISANRVPRSSRLVTRRSLADQGNYGICGSRETHTVD